MREVYILCQKLIDNKGYRVYKKMSNPKVFILA